MLSPTHERRPVQVDLAYVPPNAIPYKVRDGDSFALLAARPEVRKAKMSAIDLCFFNFRTRDPAEINWYLHHRVGCRRVTRDSRNYCFSTADDPGIVFLPSAGEGDPGGVCELPEVCKGSRKELMMNPSSGCWFPMAENKRAEGKEPLYEISRFSEVKLHDALITRVANETGIDGRLIRSIIYMETTHGYYDAPLALFGKNKSILPMNINVEYWGGTFGSREKLSDPLENIRAGAEIIRRIQAFLPPRSPVSHVARCTTTSTLTR